jgi:hypothetical protein
MDPEKYALLSFSFFAFTFAHKNSIPFAITSLILSGVPSIYLNDFYPLIPHVSSKALSTMAVL